MNRRLAGLALLFSLVSLLQGCFPVVAAGVGTGLILAQDRRTQNVLLTDQALESSISNLIEREFTGVMHVNVTSFNLNVLITGEVPEEYTRTEIGKLAAKFEKVRKVNNELTVSANSSLASRSNDSLITSNVKLRFLNNRTFNPEQVKVVTENGVVFLLGIVKHGEAEEAADIASKTIGARSVIKVFEYLD